MAKVRFENGQVVNFEGVPSPQDIEEVAQKLNIAPPTQPPQDGRETRGLTDILSSSAPVGKIDEGKRPGFRDVLSRGDLSLGQKATLLLSPSAQSLIETQKENIAPLAHGASAAAFGLPQVALEKVNPELAKQTFAEQSTLGGKTRRLSSEGVGLFSGGAANVARGTGGAFLRASAKYLPAKAGLGSAAEIIRARRSAVLMQKALQSGIEGGVFGLTQLDATGDLTEGGPSVKGQLSQAGTGFAFGGVLAKAQQGAGKIVREFRKFKTPTKTPSIKTVTERTTDSSKKLLEDFGLKKKESLNQIKQREQSLKASAKEEIELSKDYTRKNLNEARATMNENVKILEEDLQKAAEEGSLKFQERLPKFYRANSDAYGSVLDDISDDLAKSGEQITMGEVDDILNKTIGDLDEALITEGRPREMIEMLKEKYSPKVFLPQIDATYTANLPKVSPLQSDPAQSIPFKNIVEDLKMVRKALSSGARTGGARFTQEDIAVSMLNKNMGEFLQLRVPKFAGLQKDYAPVIQAMKQSTRIFKPSRGEFETKSGTALLKRFGMGKTEVGEESLMQTLQEGSSISGRSVEGVGDVTAQVLQKGKALQEAKNRIQPTLQSIREEGILKQKGVDKRLVKDLKDLSDQREFIEADFLSKENMMKDKLARRLAELGMRKEAIVNLTNDQQKVARIWKIFIYGAGAAGAVGGTASYLGRAFNRQ